MRNTLRLLSAVFVSLFPWIAFADTPSKQEFITIAHNYHYATISLAKVGQVGCAKYVQGFPIGFSLASYDAELLANTPADERDKMTAFLRDTQYARTINQILSWMDKYRDSKTDAEFQGMCMDFGGQRFMEWQQLRKSFFRLAVIFKNN